MAGGARSPYAAAVALEQWLRFGGGFVYDQHPPKTPVGVAPLDDFVARTKRGYCQHFAGSMALMLRYLGIPSRVAVGFASGRYRHGEWFVSDRDAHMWVEVWFKGLGLGAVRPDSRPWRARRLLLGLLAAVRHQRRHGRAPRGGRGCGSLGDTLAKHARLRARRRAPRPTCPSSGLRRRVLQQPSHHRRALGILRLLAFGLVGAIVLLAVTKLLLRGSRFLTRDPRRLAGACRKELRDFLLDQGVDVPASATLRELAGLVESEFDVEAGAFGLHATAARFAPGLGAREAASAMRRDLRSIRRGLRRAARPAPSGSAACSRCDPWGWLRPRREGAGPLHLEH